MHTPLTREEDGDILLILHSALRKAVAKHQASRLELFYQLQFPGSATAHDPIENLLQGGLDVMPSLEKVMTELVAEHPLFQEVSFRQGDLLAQIPPVLLAAAEGRLTASSFRPLIKAMQRLDIAINRFDMAITAALTDVDELTGLLNRTAMDRDLKRELAQAKRTGKPLCLAMVDADHFKKVNDDYGHSFGDTVLEELADRFEAGLRPRDRIYRYGGEEFLVSLPDTALQQAEKVMERIKIRCSERPVSEEEISITQTVSIGLTEVNIDEEIDSAIERADEALYQAKESGRDQVIAVARS